MKTLNLYAGIGGNRKFWTGCEVTAVELDQKIAEVYRQLFPEDTVVVGDAHAYLSEHYSEFDFIWSSPPCQSHSRMMKATRHNVAKYIDMSLYQEVLFLQHFFKGFFVVENVKPYYDFLVAPSQLIGRHCFWSNFSISDCIAPVFEGAFITAGTVAKTELLKKWLGLEYKGNMYYGSNHCPGQILRNCVHPDLGLHIFEAMKTKMRALQTEEAGQTSYNSGMPKQPQLALDLSL
jgi:DNA (cytosine-5)-methyltransferase 1